MYTFEELQLWGNSFGQQLLVATLRRSFREPLCRMALGSRFGERVCRIAALGQQLWRTALGHNFGEQRRGTALGSSFGEQLWTAFQTSWQLRAAALEFWGASLDLLVAILKSSFGEQLWGATLRLCSSIDGQLFFFDRRPVSFGRSRHLRLTRLPRHDRGPVPGGNRSAATCVCTVLRRASYHYTTRSPAA